MYSYLFVVKKLTQNKCYPLSLSKVVSVVTLGYLCRYSRLPLSLTEIDSLQVDDNQRGMNSVWLRFVLWTNLDKPNGISLPISA